MEAGSAGPLSAGTELGPYRLGELLGSGGMGKVYAATCEREAAGLAPGAIVALKVVHAHLLEAEGFFKRFLREAQIGRSVRHENVVRTFDCDAVGGHHFLVMEYVEGQTLHDLQQELVRAPEELCRHVAREVCKGLAAIHAAGVVHRDLKPENVLITPDEVVKVMDLGVARLADETIRLSQSGAFIGSVEYAAPEQFGGDVDHRCDLHSLGVVLYELSCGQHPYRGDSFPEVMKRIRQDAPRRLGEVHPQLSPFFEEVVHTLLAKDRDDRFASADELLGVLDQGEDSAWWRERSRALRAATRRPLRRIRIPRETAVYGRDDELAKLRELYEQAKSGDGQVVLVEGEAGIGKSRLIDELIGRLRQGGEDLNFLFGSYPPGGAATGAGALSTALREHFGDEGAAASLEQTPLLVPAFDAVLRGDATPSDVQPLSVDSLATCFVRATRSLAAERPTVLLIDDLHFAPDDARNLFTALALACPGHRVLLIGTLRPGVPEQWIANVSRLDHAQQISLSRLGPKDLASLFEDSFGSTRLAEELGYRIGVKSDGNPFFAFEIIRGLREGQFITREDDGSWISTRVIDEIEIPSSVMDLIQARVADLSEEERELLDVASCCGFEFDPGLVAEAVEMRRLRALKAFGNVEAKHRLVRSAGRHYTFDHHQVQEALYARLHVQMREEYHSAIAAALEARESLAGRSLEDVDGAVGVDLCEHLLAAGDGERALPYIDPAVSHLAAGHLNAQAVALADRALAVDGLLQGEKRIELLLAKAQHLTLLGRLDSERETVDEVFAIAEGEDSPRLRAVAGRSLGWNLFRAGDLDGAHAVLIRAIDDAKSAGDEATEARIAGFLGLANMGRGFLDEASVWIERAIALCHAVGDRISEGGGTSNLAQVRVSQGRYPEAQELFERALAILRETGYRRFEASTLGGLGMLAWREGRYADARRTVHGAMAISREIGDRSGETSHAMNLSLVCSAEGRSAEALELLEHACRLDRESGARVSEAIALVNLGALLLTLGQVAAARVHLHASLEISRATSARRVEAYALQHLGTAAEQLGDEQSAERQYRSALAIRREIDYRSGVATSLAALGRLAAAQSRCDAAREFLTEAADLAREVGIPGVLVESLCHAAGLPDGDAAAARSALDEFEPRLNLPGRMRARFLLWKVTPDAADLVQAHRLLQHLRDHAPQQYRDAMVDNVPLHRDVVAAWNEHGGADIDGGGEGGKIVSDRSG